MRLELINVLDHGYVKLLRVDGTDLDIENAARTSFIRSKEVVTPGFIERLARERHMSPFRHVGLWLEIKFPGDVRGQFLKHIVGNCVVEEGSTWNEQSNRGSHEQFDFHIPEPRVPQGRWGQGETVEPWLCEAFQKDLEYVCYLAMEKYNGYIKKGVAPENARKFLPFYAMYTTVRNRMSLEAAFHFWELRQSNHAQTEIKEYSKAIDTICDKYFPISWRALKVGIVT
jgi:thymidylate synthase (FAD)